MITITVIHSGKTYISQTPESLREKGVPEDLIQTGIQTYNAIKRRNEIRQKITQDVGDQQTQLGITTDAVTLALVGMAGLISGLSKAQSLSEVRAATEDLLPFADMLLAKLDSGDVKLPYETKGLGAEKAAEEVLTNMTAVANSMTD